MSSQAFTTHRASGRSAAPRHARLPCNHTRVSWRPLNQGIPDRACTVAAAASSASQQGTESAGRMIYRPQSFQEIVTDASRAVLKAIGDGVSRMEVEFPPIPTSIDGKYCAACIHSLDPRRVHGQPRNFSCVHSVQGSFRCLHRCQCPIGHLCSQAGQSSKIGSAYHSHSRIDRQWLHLQALRSLRASSEDSIPSSSALRGLCH